MFSKFISVTPIVILAVATSALGQCDTASPMCCDSVEPASSDPVATILKGLGIVVQGADVPVGVGCSPISVIGVGSAGCEASPVCCTDTNHGAVAIGCLPIGVDL